MTPSSPVTLPASIQVVERGWLSCNSIVCHDDDGITVIDSGYGSDAPETVELIRAAARDKPVRRLINTHCHSDHMGGNAALRRAFGCATTIPADEAPRIRSWDDAELMLDVADQFAERFEFDSTIAAGDTLRLGGLDWHAIAAPGHDDHALMFHCASASILISGDALWESGLGIVFPALHGDHGAFARAGDTLSAIASLAPHVVIPGHGQPFGGVQAAIERARYRLDGYAQDPVRLGRHAAKVLVSFSIMERGSLPLAGMRDYVERVTMLRHINERFLHMPAADYADWLTRELVQARAVRIEGDRMVTTATR